MRSVLVPQVIEYCESLYKAMLDQMRLIPGSREFIQKAQAAMGYASHPTCSAHMSRFDWSTDSKLVLFDNGKLSVKIYFPESEEQFTKN
jgi:hypothetical protein